MNPTSRPARAALAVGAVVVLASLAVACGAASSLQGKAVGALAGGTWACGSDGAEPSDEIVVGDDGSFAFRSLDDDPGDRQAGTWKVTGQNLRLSVGVADDREVLDVRGFGDLDVGVAEIEVQNPDDPTERLTLAVDVKSDDVVRITPKGDEAAKEFPTAPWTCERR